MTHRVRVAAPSDIPLREGRTVVVMGRRVAIFHTDEGYRAIDAGCPHRGGPLSDGIVTSDAVTCPLHGWKVCLSNGRVLDPNSGSVRVYEVQQTEEGVYLVLDTGDPERIGRRRCGAGDEDSRRTRSRKKEEAA